MTKKSLSMRLSSDSLCRLEMLARKLNVSKTACVELAIASYSRDNGVKLLMELGSYK